MEGKCSNVVWFSPEFIAALSNWRPAGRIRPANPANPARECPWRIRRIYRDRVM